MKQNLCCLLMSIPVLFVILGAEIYEISWLSNSAEFLTYLILMLGFCTRLDFSNRNFVAFLGFSLMATFIKFLQNAGMVHYLAMILQMFSFTFLIREALKHTQRETGTKYMLIFFFVLILANAYFVFDHLQTLGDQLSGFTEVGFYSIYYIVLLVLSIVALIYYLNSFSRKSVYFITLVMTIVISGILRDMAFYYVPDRSVLLLKSFLQFASVVMAFRFFATKEKKLKLINLI